MRVGSLVLLAWACVVGLAESPVLAETFTIAAFSDARSFKRFMGATSIADTGRGANDSYIVGRDWYSVIRGPLWLTKPNAFGQNVTVNLFGDGINDDDGQLAVGDARIYGLQARGVDLLIMNEAVPLLGGATPNSGFASAADEEAAKIAEFVLGGGCLVILADTLWGGQGDTMGNKVLDALDPNGLGRAGGYTTTRRRGDQTPVSGRFFDSGQNGYLLWNDGFNNQPEFHYQLPGTDGQNDPYAASEQDVLAHARFGATWHIEIDPGQWGRVIAQRNTSTTVTDVWSNILVEIPGSVIDSETGNDGAGNVLVAGDILFSNDFVYPLDADFENLYAGLPNRNWDNARILMNFVRQQAIPEPSSLMLLAIGLAGLAGGRVWQRWRGG